MLLKDSGWHRVTHTVVQLCVLMCVSVGCLKQNLQKSKHVCNSSDLQNVFFLMC